MKLIYNIIFWVIIISSFFVPLFIIFHVFYVDREEYINPNLWCEELKYDKKTLLQHDHGAKGYFRACRHGNIIVYIPNVGKIAYWHKEDFKLIDK